MDVNGRESGGGLADLFREGAQWLGDGRRGYELGVAFRAAFDGRADVYLAELTGLVRGVLRRSGLGAWPGARLGVRYMDLARLDSEEAAERLALELTAVDTLDFEAGGDVLSADLDEAAARTSGLGWIGGVLFRGGRLLGYLQAAEEDPEKALAYLATNVAREVQRRRDAADPVGSALFDNLCAGAEGAVDGTRLARENLDLWRVADAERAATERARHATEERFATAEGTLAPQPAGGPEALHAVALQTGGALAPFAAAAERNAQRPPGTRNLPLRGPDFQTPLTGHFSAWGASEPADPACVHVHLGGLANALRPALPEQPELSEVAMPLDEEGRELVIAVAPVALDAGAGALAAVFDTWRTAVEDVPRLSAARRTKLHAILDAVAARFAAGDLAAFDPSDVRRELGIKPQTFSDDWKLLRELAPLAGLENVEGVR